MSHRRRDSLPVECDASPRVDAQQSQDAEILLSSLSLPRTKDSKQRKVGRQRSSSMNMEQIANNLGYHRNEEDDIKHYEHQYTPSANMLQNLTKYSKKEQEDLMAIQSNLLKWIKGAKYLILSEFIELMEKIAPHVSTQHATDMFNQMDPSNNGQIPTHLLLHDEFLPRMILNLFQIQDDQDNRSVSEPLPDNFDLSGSDEDYELLDTMDLISSIKRMKKETKQLKHWIISVGQPAVEKLDEMQIMLDVYEAERTDKQSELQSFKKRLSKFDNLQQQLKQSEIHSNVLWREHSELLLTVQDSHDNRENEMKKYKAALREAMEYKKLNRDLQELNDKYCKKNMSLQEKQKKFETDNQDLRELILQYETEHSYKIKQIDEYKNKMESLQIDLQQFEATKQHHVKWGMDPDGDLDLYDGSSQSFTRPRARKMTLTFHDDDDDGNLDAEFTTLRDQRRRRNTIRTWYDTHNRRNSITSLGNEDDIAIERQDTEQSDLSTLASVTKQPVDTFGITPKQGVPAIPRLFSKNSNLFEDAIAQELKTELRKQIEKELREDYQMKLQQRNIQYTMELHREKRIINEEQRICREEYEKQIDRLNAQLTQNKNNIKFAMEKDEMVFMGEDNDGHITDQSTPTPVAIFSEDEKRAFDENMMHDNDLERLPLLHKEEKEKNEDVEDRRSRRNTLDDINNDICLNSYSCFGLFTGGGI